MPSKNHTGSTLISRQPPVSTLSRRDWLGAATVTAAMLTLGRPSAMAQVPADTQAAADSNSPSQGRFPVRTITRGPRHHWFAYYDKLQFDLSSRYCLGQAVDFEHRSPTADDQIEVGMVDLADNDRWIPLGQSSAWSWQQGCMLQWIPGRSTEVLYNDRQDGAYVARVIDTSTGQQRLLPRPVYSLSPIGQYAVTTDFRRNNELRPGYGYAGIDDPYRSQRAPAKTGIERIDLESGEVRMLVSLADILDVPLTGKSADAGFGDGHHWFQHLLISPDGQRTIFLHRWQTAPNRWATRMFTVGLDGSDLRELNPGAGMISHFIWRDPDHILAWTTHPSAGAAFYLMEDRRDGTLTPIGPDVMKLDGHCTYLPGNQWIINDTYPQGKTRQQEIYAYHVPSSQRVSLGHFESPDVYKGEWRCDTHPRFNQQGNLLCFDSPHNGQGRQMHLIDLTALNSISG